MSDEAPISIQGLGASLIVSYQGRSSRSDLYLAVKDNPIYCCQCDAELAEGDFFEHLWTHAPKRLQAKRRRMMEVSG